MDYGYLIMKSISCSIIQIEDTDKDQCANVTNKMNHSVYELSKVFFKTEMLLPNQSYNPNGMVKTQQKQ